MRISPMIVWASALEDEDFFAAIIADVELTHPNRLVQDAIKVYSYCVKMLLNNPNDTNRVIKAYQKCFDLASEEGCDYEDPDTGESVLSWMILSNDMYKKIDHKDITNF